MQNNEHIDDSFDLAKEAPLLSGISKDEYFKVPEGYFDTLRLEIMDKVSAKPMPWWRSALQPVSLRLAFASAALLLLVTTLYLAPNGKKSPDEKNSELAQEQVLLNYIDEETIASVYCDEKSGMQNADSLGTIDYLLDEDIDESILTQEL